MNFFDCFTIDIKARNEKLTLRRLLFSLPYRSVVLYRIASWFRDSQLPRVVRNLIANHILYKLSKAPGVEINTKQTIGSGLSLTHPHDIVIGEGVRIGKNVTIYNGVTLGALTLKAIDKNKDVSTRYPLIEDGVTIFSGAKVIGPVSIGKNSIIGANSVVNDSFPENSVIAGIPARLLNKRSNQ